MYNSLSTPRPSQGPFNVYSTKPAVKNNNEGMVRPFNGSDSETILKSGNRPTQNNLYNETESVLERTVMNQGTSSKSDVPSSYPGEEVYVIITKSKAEEREEVRIGGWHTTPYYREIPIYMKHIIT